MKLPTNIQETIISKIKLLALDPRQSNNNIKKLEGVDDCYRIRVGDYRILYRLVPTKHSLEIINIGHRSEIYK